MGLEHEMVEVLEDGLEKGIVKGVEKLIDKGLIQEIFQILMNTIEQNVNALIKRGTIAAVATIAIESIIIPAIQKAIIEVESTSNKEKIKQIQSILIGLLRKKYGCICPIELERRVGRICDIDKLGLLMEKVIESDSLEAFTVSMNSIEQKIK